MSFEYMYSIVKIEKDKLLSLKVKVDCVVNISNLFYL